RARIRPAAELDGRQDRAHHRHRASEIQDRHDEPRLQHPPAGSARANGICTRLSALTGGVRVASCKGPTPARRQNGPRSGTHLGTSAATARSAKTEIAESEYCSRFPIDATIVSVPKQRNTKEENEAIKAGKTPEGWEKQPAKNAQKDKDARW